MDIKSNLIIQIILCTLMFVSIYMLSDSVNKTESKLKEINKDK